MATWNPISIVLMVAIVVAVGSTLTNGTEPTTGRPPAVRPASQSDGTPSVSGKASRPSFITVAFEDQGNDVVKSRSSGDGNSLPRLTISPESPPSSNDAPAVDPPPIDPPPIGSYFYMQHRGGGQAGQALPYSVFGSFVPINIDGGLLFGTAQVLVDNDGNPGGGLSMGRRWYLADRELVLGLSGSFDLHQTRLHNIQHQGVVGLEGRSDRWDVLANGYLPTSDRVQDAGLTMFGPARFAGNNLVADSLDMRETALSGADVEIARRLSDQNLWAYGGWYHWQGGGQTIDGFQGGLRGYLTDRVSYDVAVTEDPVFDTNVMFQLSGFFGGSSQGRVSPTNVRTQMGEPIRRRSTVPVRETLVNQGAVPLTMGGIPITLAHVNDSGLPAGNGELTNPFGSLTAADPSLANIVYVHADTIFNGQQFTLAPGQSLFGEGNGVVHRVATDQLGLVVLPNATGGILAPLINNSAGNALTLAAGSSVSGFVIQNPVGAGVLADNTVTGVVDIANVRISGGGGIQFANSSADYRLMNIEVINPLGAAVTLANLTGRVSMQGGLIDGGPGPGIVAQDVTVLSVVGFDVTGTGGRPLFVTAGGTNIVHTTVEGNVFVGNANASFFGFAANTGAQLNLNALGNEDQIGFELMRDVNGQLRLAGSIGVNGFFNDDNGNLSAGGNTTGGGAPNVIISGAGNQIQIVDPTTVLGP